MDIEKIGNRIKYARSVRNYTLEYIASDIGVAKSTIQRYENGLIKSPKLPVLQAIANSLKVNPSWLAGKDVPMESETYEQKWDREARQFSDSINAFYYQLRCLGWSYEWLDDEELYLLTNNTTYIKITTDEYSTLINQSTDFCRKQLQKLILKSSALLNAANDKGATPEQKAFADKIMEDDNEWK